MGMFQVLVLNPRRGNRSQEMGQEGKAQIGAQEPCFGAERTYQGPRKGLAPDYLPL